MKGAVLYGAHDVRYVDRDDPKIVAPHPLLPPPLTKRKEQTNPPDPEDGMGSDRGGDVIKGTLEMIVLEVLQHEPMHGWGITERIERRSNGLLSVNQGSLYPALYRLVARGWVSSAWRASENNRNARYYSLTRLGRKQLAAERSQWDKLSRGVNLILAGAET